MEDLSNRVIESPMGSIDAYQFMLFIPGHTARHTLQIQESKKNIRIFLKPNKIERSRSFNKI